jgi:hypothetical protein
MAGVVLDVRHDVFSTIPASEVLYLDSQLRKRLGVWVIDEHVGQHPSDTDFLFIQLETNTRRARCHDPAIQQRHRFGADPSVDNQKPP